MASSAVPSSGAARKAIYRKKRALAERVGWLADVSQPGASHHTHGGGDDGLRDVVAILQASCADLQLRVTNLAFLITGADHEPAAADRGLQGGARLFQ